MSEPVEVGLAVVDDGGPPPAAASAGLSVATRARIAAAVPANTRRAYERQLAAWRDWCAEAGRAWLPASGETLAEYVAVLADRDLSPASIEQALAAIRTAHRLAGYEGAPDTRAARLVLRGHRRARAAAGVRARQAPPVTIDALRAMVAASPPAETAAGLRDRLLLVLGFALFARRSELATLRLGDVADTPDGLLVTITASKTDQDAHGHQVAIPPGRREQTCPVRLWRAWRALLADHDLDDTGPVLRAVDRWGYLSGAGMSAAAVHDAVRRAAARAGLPDPDRYSGHSLRAGGATAAYRAGAPVAAITRHGRWADHSPVVLGYLRAVDQWTDNPLADVGL